MRRRFGALLSSFGVLAAAPSVRADTPTKSECAAANETAQDLRSTGKLREARRKLAICTADSCPGPIREDCAQRLEAVEVAVPTIMVEAIDPSGHDLTNVAVSMDGEPLVQRLGGAAIEVDPGEHRFVFQAQGFKKKSETFVVREGERGRNLLVFLESAAPPPDASAAGSAGGAQRWLGVGLGAGGVAGIVLGTVVGFVAKSTYDRAVRDECGGDTSRCTQQGIQDGQTAHDQAKLATISFVAGGALLGAGAAFYFTAPRESAVAVAPTVSNGGAGLALRARW